MAGSLEKFIYTADNGTAKVILLDESNTRALGEVPATAASAITAGASLEVVRRSGKERYILVAGITAAGEKVTRKIIVPDKTDTLFVNGGTINLPVLFGGANLSVESVPFTVTQAVGERKRFALFGDTGILDGTP
jgi:hypothetical protein